jgi:hypothetical protein
MTSADSMPGPNAFGDGPTYSAKQAAAILGRSFSWLDQRLRQDEFVRPDGNVVVPLRTPGGYRRFNMQMLRDIATSSYQHGWFSMDTLKSTYREILITAHRDIGESKIPG